MKRLSIAFAVAALFIVALAPGALAAPADGNDKKQVDGGEFFDIPIFCDDADLVPDLLLDVEGWVQTKGFGGEGNPNVRLAVFHIDATFSNSDGESWTWRDRGPDRVYVNQDGDMILTISGRSGLNNVGHVVLNMTTGELLLQAGQAPFGGELFERNDVAFACDTLVG